VFHWQEVLTTTITMALSNPYTIAVPEARLKTLKAKLDLAEFPDELEAAEWDYGAPLGDIKKLTAYWRNGFDWRQQEADFNKLPNYQTKVTVDGFEPLNIHFIYQKSNTPKAIPLLFVHGCQFRG